MIEYSKNTAICYKQASFRTLIGGFNYFLKFALNFATHRLTLSIKHYFDSKMYFLYLFVYFFS